MQFRKTISKITGHSKLPKVILKYLPTWNRPILFTAQTYSIFVEMGAWNCPRQACNYCRWSCNIYWKSLRLQWFTSLTSLRKFYRYISMAFALYIFNDWSNVSVLCYYSKFVLCSGAFFSVHHPVIHSCWWRAMEYVSF